MFKHVETGKWLRCDIYVPQFKAFIEVHGKQHYTQDSFFFKSEEEFEYRKYLDSIKKNFAIQNGLYIEVNLVEITTVIGAIEYVESILNDSHTF